MTSALAPRRSSSYWLSTTLGHVGGRRRQGHFCWCCESHHPNEAFSGGGHRDHLCRSCAKLPREERERRQAVRDIDRLVEARGKRQRRRRVERIGRFLEHPDPRVIAHAEQTLAMLAARREETRHRWEREELEVERWAVAMESNEEPAEALTDVDLPIPF